MLKMCTEAVSAWKNDLRGTAEMECQFVLQGKSVIGLVQTADVMRPSAPVSAANDTIRSIKTRAKLIGSEYSKLHR